MKRILLLITLTALFAACGQKTNRTAEDVAGTSLQVERYDRVEIRYLKTGDFTALQQMNTGYPVQTRLLIEDILKLGYVNDPMINVKFVGYYRDSTLQVILDEVERQYADMNDIDRELSSAFAALRRFLPEVDPPLVYAQVSALDESIVISEGMVGISLDKYLGSSFPIYTAYYPAAQRATMDRTMIVPDCLMFYLLSMYPGDYRDEDDPDRSKRDIHAAKIQWVVNQSVGRRAFVSSAVTEVDNYMRNHPKTAVRKLLSAETII